MNNMKCVICGVSVGSVESQLDIEDWGPFFFEGEDPHGPVCPDCCDSLLMESPEGDLFLKDEFRGKISYLYEFDFENDDCCEIQEVMLGYILN